MDAHEQIYLHTLAAVRTAQRGDERRQAVRHAAAVLGVSENTVYRGLKARGWSSGRAARADRGTSAASAEQVEKLAAVMAKGRNKRGQPNIPVKEAVQIAQAQGLVSGDVGYAQLCRRLRAEGLSPAHMAAPSPGIERVSQHPNHVWFVDISVAIQWYFKDATGARKLGLYSDSDARFYEGKRANLAGRDKILHRYTIVDHYSGAYYVRYYYAAGENSVDVIDFLYRAMSAKDSPLAFPLRGVPLRLVADQGPAFKAALVQTLLTELDITPELHATGNAKASGAVESRHLHWQRTFEGRLALLPAENVEEINRQAEKFCAVANSERPHSRHGRPPMALWATIRPEQLQEAPDRETFLQMASGKKRTATLCNRLRLRADSRTWEIAGPHIHPKQQVQFRLAPFRAQGIRVWDAEGRELAATELRFDEVSGFVLNGRRHVWDDDEAKGATAPATPGQKISAAVAEEPNGLRMPDIWDDLDERMAKHAYLGAQRGQAWQGRDTELQADALISSIEVREEVVARLGRPLTLDEGEWWRAQVGAGCTRDELEDFLEAFTAPGRTTATPHLAGQVG